MDLYDFAPLNNLLTEFNPQTLWLFFGIFLALAILASFILVYHWNKYRLHSPATSGAQVVYIAGVVILLLVSAGALMLHTF